MSSKPHFSILAKSFAGGPRPRTVASILFGLWFLLFFCALFAPPVLDDADATHANAARAMASTGDLVTLKVNGIRYLEKAPLPYWLVAGSFRLFGFNTFATHLPQALAVLLLMLLGHRWANQAFGARTGFYTALAILTSLGVFLFTRIFIPEVWLSLFLGAALFAFLKSMGPIAAEVESSGTTVATPDTAERPAQAWYAGKLFYPAVMWASLACAVLSKGLVALVFFFAAMFLFLLLTGELRQVGKLFPVTGILLFLAIAAPWHILAGMRNTGGTDGHGFFWFYFVNEHVLRFLGERIPRDFNKLPGWVFWMQHVVWLFPWILFLPLGIGACYQRILHQRSLIRFRAAAAGSTANLEWSPFHRIDPQQRSILLLCLFSIIVLLFFSLSTNQEYYTFPIYLPALLLIAATITRAEQTFSSNPSARRALTFAHASLAVIGGVVTVLLLYGLWSSRHLPYIGNVGDALAHRGVADYTLSMSHLFDLTTASFAGLRLPAVLAIFVLTLGPAIAWLLRQQRRHIAATSAIAFTSAGFLFAAQIAFVRFGNMLSSADFAHRIAALERVRTIDPSSRVALYGDQANGSSIPFYLGRTVDLVEGKSTSMLFGASFPDAPQIFLTDDQYRSTWGVGERKILFVPQQFRQHVATLLGPHQFILDESSGKALITDRPLEPTRKQDFRH